MKTGNAIATGLGALGILISGWLLLGPGPKVEHGVPTGVAEHAASLPLPPAGSADAELSEGAVAPVPEATGGAPTEALPVYTEPVRDRARANRLREALAAMYTVQPGAKPDKPGAAPVRVMPNAEGEGNQAQKPLGEYVKRVMSEQFSPLVGSCYEELLGRNGTAAGTVVLEFSVMGDAAVGGVVVDVRFGKGTTLADDEFATCTRESMFSVIFDAPPQGKPTITVTQSFELAP